ncbi:MAG: hypothetical protein J7M19_07775 [Planctomycetes bacterium]|nr:hypothetical protein [Planctomycetota bacterium]
MTSVYLGCENAAAAKQEFLAQFKDLTGKSNAMMSKGRSHSQKASIKGDVEICTQFLENIRKVDVRGLAMFSCSEKGVFESVGVAMPFRPHIIVADSAAVAPLYAALDEFKRIAVCVLDRREAKLYEYFMGRMEEVKVFTDNVPGRVRMGGWSGYEQARIARHIASREFVHLKNVAEILFEQFKLRGFDWLFLGVRSELREDVEHVLHAYVRDRLKGYIDAGLSDSVGQIGKLTRQMAQDLKARENRQLVERLAGAAGAGGPAVTGLRKTLEALNAAAVGMLVVRSDLVRNGVHCGKCGHLGIKSRTCPLCGENMTPAANIIEIAEESAASLGAEIRHVNGESHLDDFEGVGAFLRFPLGK